MSPAQYGLRERQRYLPSSDVKRSAPRLAVHQLELPGVAGPPRNSRAGAFPRALPGRRSSSAARAGVCRSQSTVSLPPVQQAQQGVYEDQGSSSNSPEPQPVLRSVQSMPNMPTAEGRARVHVNRFDPKQLLSSPPAGWKQKEPSPGELGPRALACALVERCGSLEGAWRLLGAGGRLSHMQWMMGLSGLGLDVEQVCGVPGREMFRRMASYNGEVTPETWEKFFKSCYESPEAMDAMAEAARQHALQARPGYAGRAGRHHRGQRGVAAQPPTPSRPARRGAPAPGGELGELEDVSTPSSSSAGPSPTSVKSTLGLRPLPTISEELAAEAALGPEERLELETQAKAEQEVLEEELASLNLQGIEALAYVLTAKLGSVKKAFTWFDMTQSGKVANVEFDTGIRLLRIDLERLTGLDKRGIWRSMDRSSKGVLKKGDWKDFFREALAGVPADALKRAARTREGGSLAERARKRRREAEEAEAAAGSGTADGPSAEGQEEGGGMSQSDAVGAGLDGASAGHQAAGRSPGAAQSGVSEPREGEPEEEECSDSIAATARLRVPVASALGQLTEEELSFRERVLQELSRLPAGGRAEYPPEGAEESLGARRARIVEEVAAELGLFAHVFGLNDLWSDRRPASCKPARSMTDESEDTVGVFVFNLAGFAEEVRAQLRALPLGERLEFPAELSPAQRQVVHFVAEALGLWTQSEGQGHSRRVLAFNLGGLAGEIRRKLEALEPGESIAFPADFTEVQRKLVHMLASELELWSYSEGEGSARHVEVFNLARFAEEVREELSRLGPGEHRSYEPSLSEKHRKVVHCIAAELGLQHGSHGEGTERHVTVANLHDFQSGVRRDLERLLPGETKTYEASLSALQRKGVHLVADAMELDSWSHGTGLERQVSVKRPDEEAEAGSEGKGGRKRRRKSPDEDGAESEEGEEETETEESKIESLFDAYATGNFKGRKVFIGFRDLAAFADDLREAMPVQHRRFRLLREDLDMVFEDTLQLQIDFGTRTKKGLTLQWFKVFIQKSARKVGMSVMGMLIAVLGNAATA